MGIEISPETEARLTATAHAQGISVDGLLARWVNEFERLATIVDRNETAATRISQEDFQAKIERGFLQSERGEVLDGGAFVARLLDEVELSQLPGG